MDALANLKSLQSNQIASRKLGLRGSSARLTCNRLGPPIAVNCSQPKALSGRPKSKTARSSIRFSLPAGRILHSTLTKRTHSAVRRPSGRRTFYAPDRHCMHQTTVIVGTQYDHSAFYGNNGGIAMVFLCRGGFDLECLVGSRLNRQTVVIDLEHNSRHLVLFRNRSDFRFRNFCSRRHRGLCFLGALCALGRKSEDVQFFVTRHVHLAVGDDRNYVGVPASPWPAASG